MINLFRSRQRRVKRQAYASPSPTVQARVVFVTFEPGGVIIDLMAGPVGYRSAPLPVALEAVLPHSTWAVAAAGMLDRWARTAAEIELRARGSEGNPRVQLSDGTSRTLLDLRRAPDPFRSSDCYVRVMRASHASARGGSRLV
jgi:hypothetical protein